MQIDVIRVRETLLLDAAAAVRETGDGYLTATPRVARTGIQIYGGKEVGRPEMDRVRVWRPEDEVFSVDAMSSLAHRPITNDHPKEAVNAGNWKKYAVGQVGDEVARDGEYIRVPLALMDSAVIKDVKDGKKEISLGYSANLEWRTGVTPKGEAYDAVQTGIRINHLAIVDAARGGTKLVIGDAAVTVCDAGYVNAKKLIQAGKVDHKSVAKFNVGGNGYLAMRGQDMLYPISLSDRVSRHAIEAARAQALAGEQGAVVEAADSLLALIQPERKAKTMSDVNKTITVDSINLEVTDTAAAVILRALQQRDATAEELKTQIAALQEKLKGMQGDSAKQVTELTTSVGAKDAEIVTLKKQLEDAKITPTKLDQLVKDRSLVIARAHAVLGDKIVADGKTEGEIRRQVVADKLGDACKDWDDNQIRASFDTLTAGVDLSKLQDNNGQRSYSAADHINRSFAQPGNPGNLSDADKAYDKYKKDIGNRWKAPTAAA